MLSRFLSLARLACAFIVRTDFLIPLEFACSAVKPRISAQFDNSTHYPFGISRVVFSFIVQFSRYRFVLQFAEANLTQLFKCTTFRTACQAFFKSFSKNKSAISSNMYSTAKQQLNYYTTFISVCQYLFEKYFPEIFRSFCRSQIT